MGGYGGRVDRQEGRLVQWRNVVGAGCCEGGKDMPCCPRSFPLCKCPVCKEGMQRAGNTGWVPSLQRTHHAQTSPISSSVEGRKGGKGNGRVGGRREPSMHKCTMSGGVKECCRHTRHMVEYRHKARNKHKACLQAVHASLLFSSLVPPQHNIVLPND